MPESERRNYKFGHLCSLLGHVPNFPDFGKVGYVRSIDGLMHTLTPSCNDFVYENCNDHALVFATVLFAS